MATTPSIAMIPSGYKDEKVYSVLPTSGDGDFTFARTSTATRVNSNGLIEEVGVNKPRLDYSDGACPSLLLEPQRLQLVQYSEDTTQWDKNGTPINTSNTTISPNGLQNADSVIVNSVSEGFYDFSIGTVQSGTSYTFSIFIKYISGIETIRFGPTGGGFGGDNNNVFNIKNGTVVSSVSGNTLSVNDYGNGWYRLIATKNASSTATAAWLLYGNENAEIQCSAWGAQVEQGSYATSYIKNEGTVAGITRAADTATGSGDATVINSTEGTLYFEGNAFSSTGSSGLISLNVGTTNLNNRVTIELDGANVKARFAIGGTSLGIFNYATDITQVLKIAVKYKANDFALWVNGTERVPLTSGNSFSANTLSELDFNRGDGQEPFIGNTNDLRVYATALSDEELITLTTI